MSRKHYVAIARVINAQVGAAKTIETLDAVKAIANDLAEVMANDNPNFETRRFLVACGVE
jgi:hypothetical protein